MTNTIRNAERLHHGTIAALHLAIYEEMVQRTVSQLRQELTLGEIELYIAHAQRIHTSRQASKAAHTP